MSKESTQWTAQFLVAAELCRRGYMVAFTNGNLTPKADMMVGTAYGAQFWVDAKGVRNRNTWRISQRPTYPSLYYILTGVGQTSKSDEFFILTDNEMVEHLSRYKRDKNRPDNWQPGFGYRYISRCKDRWDKLPPPDSISN